MKKIFIVYFFLILLSQLQCKDANENSVNLKIVRFTKVKEMGRGALVQPGLPAFAFNYMAILDSLLLVSNTKGDDPFYVFNLNNYTSYTYGKWGNGPNEFKENYPIIVSSSDEYFYIYSPLQSRLTKVKSFNKTIEANLANQLPSLGVFYVYNDTSALLAGSGFSMKQSGNYGEGFFLDISSKNVIVKSNGLKFGNQTLLSQMENVKSNPILSNGTFLWKNHYLYWFSFYSSLKVVFDETGNVVNSSFGVRNIQFPDAKIRDVGNGTITADPESMTQCYLSLTSNENHIFALFSGENITEKMIFASRSGKLLEPIHLGEGKFVDVFETETLNYLYTIELPTWASGIITYKNFLIVSESGEYPCLSIYDNPF